MPQNWMCKIWINFDELANHSLSIFMLEFIREQGIWSGNMQQYAVLAY